MIPKKIHFIFGLDEKFINKPFSYFHYLNILSAHKTNVDYKINFFYHYKPDGELVDKLSEFCDFIYLDDIPKTISGKNFKYKEHICDFLRLNILYEYGGIYLDIDTLCLKPFDDLLNNQCVMGLEYGTHKDHGKLDILIGLCNAVILSKPKSEFLKVWIEEFKNDYKEDWSYNCVQMPYNLSKTNGDEIKILHRNSFFKYSWDIYGKEDLFVNNSDTTDCYLLHLWESKNYDILKQYTKENIPECNNTVTNIYKTLIS